MPITWKTVVLAEPQKLQFGDCEPIIVERADERLDLRVSSSHGAHCVLEGVVDTDERFHDARITVFTGSDPAEMFLFGGPQAYRLCSDGSVVDRVATLRDFDEYEVGSLDILLHDNLAVIVYEVGILVIDDRLTQLWQRPKYMDRRDISIADGLLCLREPFTRPIKHRLGDGELVSRHHDYTPGVRRGRLPDDREIVRGLLYDRDGEGLAGVLPTVEAALARRTDAKSTDEIEGLRRLIAQELEALRHCDPDDPGDGAALDRIIDGWLAVGGDLKQLRDLISDALLRLWRDRLSNNPGAPGSARKI